MHGTFIIDQIHVVSYPFYSSTDVGGVLTAVSKFCFNLNARFYSWCELGNCEVFLKENYYDEQTHRTAEVTIVGVG